MRQRLITFLILLMIALPVWSASMSCCHVQMQQPVSDQQTAHTCCHHAGAEKCPHASADSAGALQADDCQCDQFQHSQFVLNLPQLPVVQSAPYFAPEFSIPTPLAERHETIIRPPIA